MSRIRYERKNVVEKQKVSSKYHQLFEKCNSLHVSSSCAIHRIFATIEQKQSLGGIL